jgi:hypothetical protein
MLHGKKTRETCLSRFPFLSLKKRLSQITHAKDKERRSEKRRLKVAVSIGYQKVSPTSHLIKKRRKKFTLPLLQDERTCRSRLFPE